MTSFNDLARSAAALATGRLGWPPDQFWESTVVELETALAGGLGVAASAPLGRAELADLETKVNADG